MTARILYKVTFLNAGKVYELYARRVGASALWGFTEVADLVFDVAEGVVVDPTEERLRAEFATCRCRPWCASRKSTARAPRRCATRRAATAS